MGQRGRYRPFGYRPTSSVSMSGGSATTKDREGQGGRTKFNAGDGLSLVVAPRLDGIHATSPVLRCRRLAAKPKRDWTRSVDAAPLRAQEQRRLTDEGIVSTGIASTGVGKTQTRPVLNFQPVHGRISCIRSQATWRSHIRFEL